MTIPGMAVDTKHVRVPVASLDVMRDVLAGWKISINNQTLVALAFEFCNCPEFEAYLRSHIAGPDKYQRVVSSASTPTPRKRASDGTFLRGFGTSTKDGGDDGLSS